jgi:acetoin utilization protein AcuC
VHQQATHPVLLIAGDAIARYGFPGGHPFGTDRHEAFMAELKRAGLCNVIQHQSPRVATRDELLLFHTPEHIDLVLERSHSGLGFLDGGDTPAFKGVYEAAAHVVGSSLLAMEAIMAGTARRAFVPIAGLHHATRSKAAGFCAFNDCGVVIEALRQRHGIRRIAYVDIDAHHGDGVFYSFQDDPDLLFADIHEDGDYLFPGTGAAHETGEGDAVGTKLNIPLPPQAGDDEFMTVWPKVESYLELGRPDFILLQCGADSLGGDPLTHLNLTVQAHGYATERLCALADRLGHGRVLAMGGGGYNRQNLAKAWVRVVQGLVGS